MARSDLGLAREIAANGKPLFGATRSLQTPVLNMTGGHSPHVEATVAFNGRLQPNKCTWMKIQDAAMVLEEQPGKVAEAVKLFLQGLGFVFRPRRLAAAAAAAKKQQSPSPISAKEKQDKESTTQVKTEDAKAIDGEDANVTNDLLPGLAS